MENRKVEISMETSVTVGRGDNYQKNRLFVALGAEPAPDETREQVAATLFADASKILAAQATASAASQAPAQALATATAAAMETTQQAQVQAAAAPPVPSQLGIGILYICGDKDNGCVTPEVKDTPGNRSSLEYSKSKGYPPLCYKCKVRRGIIKAR